MSATVPAVRLRTLGFRYPDGRATIDGVELDVAAGESVGIIGPNGAGKTTLIHLIAGLLAPSSGRVEIRGRALGAKDDRDLRREIGVVFQETEDQLFSPTVFEDVAFGPIHFALDGVPLGERVARALEKVGLGGFEDRVSHHLSSGERRRVALATVLACEPSILLLDEPTSGLDPRGRRELLGLLRGIDETLVVASHDLEFVLRTCARAVIVDGGRVAASDRTSAILADSTTLERHGLEAPLGLRGRSSEELDRLVRDDG